MFLAEVQLLIPKNVFCAELEKIVPELSSSHSYKVFFVLAFIVGDLKHRFMQPIQLMQTYIPF